jgi:hypothetical protein
MSAIQEVALLVGAGLMLAAGGASFLVAVASLRVLFRLGSIARHGWEGCE